MHFTRLRLQGFKSFVEPTDLHIAPGMTGIVGPNGCGKSNLIEALRWVMGENSAKRMRGAEMDDVIFAGTTTRPSRNLAEVMLELDNSSRTATTEFNNEESIQVTRQIERGSGSDYRVNGKAVRQRDVQLLFADQATGAHSTNLVGQGQIDALIRAKPQDRRQILEEASGTAGLHARRHEAELKLKGAETNLTRVDDVLKTYDTQLRSLKTQVRQASRYRNLAEHIRRTEAALLHLRWVEAEQNADATKDALQQAEARVNELLSIVTQGSTTRTDIAAELPGLRQTEAAASAVVQKLSLMREQIEIESKRIADATTAEERRLAHAQTDREREQARHADGHAAMIKLDAEREQLAARQAEITAKLPEATRRVDDISDAVEQLDHALTELTQSVATAEARRQSLQTELESLMARHAVLAQKRAQLDTERVALAADVADRPDLSFASAFVDASELELARREQQMVFAEQTYQEAETIQASARAIDQEAQARVTKIKAESDAIAALLQQQETKTTPVLDLITVTPGFEHALAVALGEALTAALDTNAAMHWRETPLTATPPSWPEGVAALDQYIQAPPALARSLAYIGIVDDQNAGQQAAAQLQPGQIVVSRDGWAWRWDGFTVTPEAKTATALRLQQRNRLTALQADIANAEAEAQSATAALSDANAFFDQRKAEDRKARDALQAAFAALKDARDTYTKQEKQATAITTKLAALDASLRQIQEDAETVRVAASINEDARRDLPDVDTARAEMVEMRTRLAEQRSQQARYDSDREQLVREQKMSEQRSRTVEEERTAWQARLENATAQITALDERITAITAQLADLRGKPAELASQHAQILTELSGAEASRKQAADLLIATEQKLHMVEVQLKQDEAQLSAAREERVRAEGLVQAASEHFNVLRERMQEKLNCGPDELIAIAAFADDEAQPAIADLEQALARYLRERDNIGPVNLRAETEAETMQGDIDKLQKDKDDLVAAIAKLRQGITALNHEARDRLQTAFTQVNERFQILFQRLFVGGKAHLELIDNEDPLNAGLEIFAAPPGKKTQILSLLSGGERTLTALALLFAVFQTNPSPICVLDEAEAALDESNIGRFCQLVEDIARETGTRFLIITHQRLTMARMDRLYGVTMGEKGVSQLVSVDLAAAVAIRDGEQAPNGELSAADKAEAALEQVRAA